MTAVKAGKAKGDVWSVLPPSPLNHPEMRSVTSEAVQASSRKP